MPRKTTDTPLTKETIIQAASALITLDGVEAFSMRRLATILEVNPMAIYYYLPNKEAIIQAVVEQALSGLQLTPSSDWQDAVRVVGTTYKNFAHQHPELFAYVIRYDRSIPVAFAIDEYLVSALLTAGFDHRQTIQIVYLVIATIAGLTLSELRGAVGRARDLDEVHHAFTQLPRDNFSAIHALAASVQPSDMTLDFNFALEVLIAGIEAHNTR